MANTVIQLKYSNVTGTPPSLNLAEPAYSNVSNKLWIDDGSGVVAIGGKFYTDLLDAGTSLATQNTFVRRDTSGNFAANTITVNTISANTSVIQNGYDLYAFANAAFTQANTAIVAGGEIAGGYANSAYIHANSAYESQNTTGVYANSAYDAANVADQRAVTSGDYANSAYALANTSIQETGGIITGDLSITGNLIISGNTVTQDVSTLNIADPLIYLAANNYSSDIVDIGFAGNYYDGSNQRHAGFIRKHNTDNFYLFTNYEHEPDNNIIDVNDASFRTATLYANVHASSILIRNVDPLDHANAAFASANTADQRAVTSGDYANSAFIKANSAFAHSNLTSDYATAGYAQANIATQYATSAGSYANSAYIHANAAFNIANTDVTNVSTSAGNYGSASVVPSFRVEANGRISSISTNSIAIDASAITTGTLGVSRGGTGNTAFTSNHVILGNGTGALTTVGSSTEGHLLTINSSGVPVFQHLNGGTF